MANVVWTTGVSGNWATAANWSTGVVPSASDDVTIGAAGTYTVTINSAVEVHSLTLSGAGATVSDQSALTLGTTLSVTAGIFALDSGGSVIGGTIAVNGGAVQFNGGTLDGVTYEGILDLTAQSSFVTIVNGLSATGTNGSGPGAIDLGAYSSISFQDTQTVDNATITLGGYGSGLYVLTTYADYVAAGYQTPSATLTLGRNLTIDQTGGYDNYYYYADFLGSSGYGGGAIVNDGTINAEESDGALVIDPASFTNDGTITVTNGDTLYIESTFINTAGGTLSVSGTGSTAYLGYDGGSWSNAGSISVSSGAVLVLYGNYTTAELDAITDDGGTVYIDGTLTNTGATLTVGPGTALPNVVLGSGGAIVGGTIEDSGSGVVFSGGTLDGVTYEGTLDLTAQSSSVTIADGLTATGMDGTGPGSIDLGTYSSISFQDTQTVDNATITLGGDYGSDLYVSTTYADYVAAGDQTPSATLTLGSNLTIDQTGGYNYYYYYADFLGSGGYGGGAIVNDGTINAEASDGAFVIDPASFTNDGTVTVTNGDTLYLESTFTNAADGMLSVSGTGSTAYLGYSGGSWSNSGSISVGSGAVLALYGSYTTAELNAISDNGGTIYIEGTLTNTGATLTVGPGTALPNVVLGSGGSIVGGTLEDLGSGVTFSGGILEGVTYEGTLDLTPESSSVTIMGGLTATGEDGTGAGAIDLGTYSSITFQDTQTVDNATITLGGSYGSDLYVSTTYADYVAAGDQTPSATLTLGSNLTIDQTGGYYYYYPDYIGSGGYGGGAIVNDGTINAEASEGALVIDPASVTNNGTVTVTNGDALYLESTFTNAADGTLSVSGTGSTAYLGYNGGSWSNAGSISVSSGAVLVLYGSYTTAELDAITDDGGTIYIDGTLTNTGATLTVGPGTALPNVVLGSDGSIVGGTIQDLGSGIEFSGGTLQGVTYEGTLDLTTQSSSVTIVDGLTAIGEDGTGPGTIDLGNYSSIVFQDTQTIDNATITLGGSYGSGLYVSSTYADYVAAGYETPSVTLTLGSNLTIDQTGGSYYYSPDYLAGTGYGGNIVNDGTINAEASDGTLVVEPESFTNKGTITVTNGDSLTLEPGTLVNAAGATIAVQAGSSLVFGDSGGTASNAGTISANDATVTFYWDGPQSNTGTLDITNSTVDLYGSFTTPMLAPFVGQNDVVNVYGTLDNSGSTLVVGTPPVQGNLLVNGSFETGSLSGWTLSGNAGGIEVEPSSYSYGAENGDYYAYVGPAGSNGVLSQTFADTPGETLVISGWLAGNGTEPSDFTMSFDGTTYVDVNPVPDQPYTEYTFTVTASGEDTFAVGVRNDSSYDAIDNFSVTPSNTVQQTPSPSLSQLRLDGTIQGGTLLDQGSGVQFDGGTLDGVTYEGTLDLTPVDSSVTIVDGLTATGVSGTGPGNVELGQNSSIYFDDTQTFDNATIALTAPGAGIYENTSYVDYVAAGYQTPSQTLTLGSNLTIDHTGGYSDQLGSSGYGGNIANDGTINAEASDGDFVIDPVSFTNDGSIAVTNGDTLYVESAFTNAAGGTLSVSGAGSFAYLGYDGSSWSNQGSISVGSGGGLVLYGNYTTAQLGAITDDGGTIYIDGTLTNTGATLTVGPGTALPNIVLGSGGAIVGGTIDDLGSGVQFSGGTLDGVAYEGTLNLTPYDSSVTIVGGLTAAGPDGAGLGNVELGQNSSVYFDDTQTFDNATITLAAPGAGLYESTSYADYVAAGYQTPTDTLTLGSNLTVDHTSGYSDQLSYTGYGGDIVNDGTINAEASYGELFIDPISFTNDGTIAVTNNDTLYLDSQTLINSAGETISVGAGSSLVFGDSNAGVTNAGTISANGATVTFYWDGPASNTGTLDITDSTVDLYGSFTTAMLAPFAGQGDTVNIYGTVTNQPLLSNAESGVSYAAGGPPVAVDPVLTVSDPDSVDLVSATATISSGFFSGDTLAANTSGTNINASYDASTGVLTLTGSDTVADYQSVLDTVAFSSSVTDPTASGSDSSRTITFVANDANMVSTPFSTTIGVIGPKPDLVVTTIAAPTQAIAGQPIELSWTLENDGTATAVGPWQDDVYLASDAAGDNPQLVGTFEFEGSIAPGQTATQTELVTLPSSLSGSEWFVVQADAENQTGAPPGENHEAVATMPTAVTTTINWSSLETTLQPPSIDSTDWSLIWDRFVDQVGTTVNSLQTALSQATVTLGELSQPSTTVAELSYELEQASGVLPNITLADTTDIADAGTGLDLSLTRTYSASLLDRNNAGVFGDGWTFTYGVTATTDASRNVYITSPSGTEVFTLQSNGTYAAEAGDTSTLTLSDGAFALTDASGTVEQFLPDGQLSSITDSNGNTVTVSYGSNGVISGVTSSNGQSLTFTTNSQGRITSATDGEGQTTTYTYDASGDHLLSVSGPDGVTSYSYSASSNAFIQNALTQVINPDVTTESFQYDSQGNLTSQSGNNRVGQVTYSYGGVGTVTETDAAGNATTLIYDANGNLAESKDALGSIMQYEYNSVGELTGVVTPTGGTYAYSYDSDGDITGYTDPNGGTVSATYAPGTDLLTSLTDQDGNTTDYSYNSAGDLTGITYDDGSGTSYQYSANGVLTSSTDALGQTTTYECNAQGLLTRETFSDGTFQAYAYNAQGELISAQATNGGVTAYGYNAAGELNSVTNPNGQVESYTYNSAGQELTRTEPDGSVTQYSYNSAGELAELQDGSGNLITQYTYNSQGQLIGSLDGNAQTTSYAYDSDGNVTQILTQAADGTTTSELNYTYDADGRPVTATSLDGTWTYTYDSDGELTNAVFASTNASIPDQNLTYEYDAAGNRTETIFNGAVNNYTTNGLNQYTASDGTTYDYDADGNLVSVTQNGATTTYTYNSQSELVAEAGQNGDYTYQYDALGNMVQSTDNGVLSNYIIDPLAISTSATGPLSAIAQVYNADGDSTATYDYGDGLAAVTSGSGTDYFNVDADANVTSLSGEDGDLVDTYDYSPFGVLLASTGNVENPFQYSGGLGLNTGPGGLVFMRARYYDPTLGGFISADPAGIAGSLNLYSYADNDPINLIDPLGLQPINLPGIGILSPQELQGLAAQSYADSLVSQATSQAWQAIGQAATQFFNGPVFQTIEGIGQLSVGGALQAIELEERISGGELPPIPGVDRAIEDLIHEGANNFVGGLDKQYPGVVEEIVKDILEFFNPSASAPPSSGLPPPVIVPPPTLPPLSTAGAFGCPHFTTFDGLSFDFQGAGEFIAAQSTVPGNTFQVQIRIEPEGSEDSSVSIITQIAVQVGSDRVTFDAGRAQVVWVDGTPAAISPTSPVFTLNGGTVTEVSENEYQVVENTGEVVTVDPFGDGMGFSIALSPNDGPGSVEGFLGSDEGQANDFQLPNGTVLQQPLTQDELYQTFANAWRVTDATSLFDYGPGQDTETFTNTQYPREILTLADFPPDVVSAAAALVAAAGITDPTLAADAEFDYITMGNPSFITEDAAAAGITPIVTSTPVDITQQAVPPPSIGVLPAIPEVTESTGTTTPVTFYVNLTSAATADTVIDYAVTPNVDSQSNTDGKVFFDASDFGGTLPSGSVTISAGETEAAVTIDVPNTALGSSPEEWLGISVSTPGSNPVYDPTAQTEILNNMPVAGPPAEPVFELLSSAMPLAIENSETLVQVGNSYTLDLGQILNNVSLPPLQFALANMAAPGADDLSSDISALSGTGFQVTGSQPPTTISAGDTFSDLYFQPETSTLGVEAELLTVSSEDVNDTGYEASLPDLMLTVEDSVIAPAEGVVSSQTLLFPNVRVGTAETQTITISNDAVEPAANLDVTTTAGSGAVSSGSVDQLAPGASDGTDLSAGLDTDTAGLDTGTVTLNLFSDLGNGVEVPALPSPTITLSGGVYREATAQIMPSQTFVHVGGPGTIALDVANTDPADGYSESLIASLATATGDFAIDTEGPTDDIAAGSSSGTLAVSFSTGTAAILSGSATINLTSDGGTGADSIDGLGQIALAAQTLPLTVTVDSYAQPVLQEVSGGGGLSGGDTSYTLDFGSVAEGTTVSAALLEVLNDIAGPADTLSGSFGSFSGDTDAFVNSGFGSIGSLIADADDTAPSISLNTTTAGIFSETVTLNPTDSNPDYSAPLTPVTLTVDATVTSTAAAAAPTVDDETPPAPVSIDFGNVREGTAPAQALTIANTAGSPAQSLDVSVTGTTGNAISNGGSINQLAAASSDSSSISVGLTTGTAGLDSGTVTLSLGSDNGLGTVTPLPSEMVDLSADVYREATAPALSSPAAIYVHSGQASSASFSVTNGSAADGFSEQLITSVTNTTGDVSLGSTPGELAGGASGTLVLDYPNETTAGTYTGSATVDFQSDGSVDNASDADLGSQTIDLTETVNNLANPVLQQLTGGGTLSGSGTSYTLNFGSVAEYSTPLEASLEVLNDVPAFVDTLSGSFGSFSGNASDFVNSGFASLGELLADEGADSSVSLNTGLAGAFSETVTLDPTDANPDYFSSTVLPPIALTVEGKVTPVLASATVDGSPPPTATVSFGNVREGASLSQALTIANPATPPAQALDVSVTGVSGSATSSGGSITGLAAGASNSSSISVGLNTGTVGLVSGTVSLGLTSDDLHGDTTSLTADTVTVKATVFRQAVEQVGNLPANFIVHVNQTGSTSVSISNTAANDSYSEGLITSVTGMSGSISATAPAELAGGASGNLTLGFSAPGTAGTNVTLGSATLQFYSDGSNDGAGVTSLGASQGLTVTATVDNYAVASLVQGTGSAVTLTEISPTSYSLSFGTVTEASATETAVIDLLNGATGPADLLEGSFSVSGSTGSFTDSGFGSFSGVTAGSSFGPMDISLKTGTSGTFTETVQLMPTGYNASGYSGALPANTLTVTGAVQAPAGQVYTTTTGQYSFTPAANQNNNTIIAAGGTLNAGDVLNFAGTTGNTLALQGAGIFNMTLPTTLTGIGTITAQEGQSSYVSGSVTYVSEVQTIELVSGLDTTINVAAATLNPNNPTAATIDIVGAAGDSSTINLATGNDTVTLGSNTETVNGGGGNNTFNVTASTIGATINGGSGTNDLDVSGGGTMTMGSNITKIAEVVLTSSTTAYNFTANGIAGLEVADLSTGTSDIFTAGAASQLFAGGGAGKLTMNFNNESNDTLKNTAASLKGDTVENLIDGDAIDISNIAFNGSTTETFAASGSNTTLTVKNGSTSTAITLFGQYAASNFSFGADSSGTGTLVTVTHQLSLSSPH